MSNHTQAQQGELKLQTSAVFLNNYVKKARPQIAAESVYVFPNSKGKSLDHLSRHVQILVKCVGIALPTSFLGRHAAATAVVCRGSETQQILCL